MENLKNDTDLSDKKDVSYADEWPDGYSKYAMKNLATGKEKAEPSIAHREESKEQKEIVFFENKIDSTDKSILCAMREFSSTKIQLLRRHFKNIAAL